MPILAGPAPAHREKSNPWQPYDVPLGGTEVAISSSMSPVRNGFGKYFWVRSSDREAASPPCGPAVTRNIAQIVKLEEQQIRARSFTARVAHTVTRAAGTAPFAIAHLAWFAAWIGVNSGLILRIRPFDPFPFNLLTMVTSLEAIFLSIWILISQNEMARQVDRRSHLDLQVNILAEQEATATLGLVKQIAERMGIDVSRGDGSLTQETDLEHVALTVDEALPESPVGTTLPPPPLRM